MIIRFLFFFLASIVILRFAIRKAEAKSIETNTGDSFSWNDSLFNVPSFPDESTVIAYHDNTPLLDYSWETAENYIENFLPQINLPTGFTIMNKPTWLEAAETTNNGEYLRIFNAAEAKYGIPTNMITRLAWQESRYNPQAFNAISTASGIMQMVPKWHINVNPWNPPEAIDYGAKYLSDLYRQFGTWEYALKAYNWGPGNLQKWFKGNNIQPLETVNYSREILADLSTGGFYG